MSTVGLRRARLMEKVNPFLPGITPTNSRPASRSQRQSPLARNVEQNVRI